MNKDTIYSILYGLFKDYFKSITIRDTIDNNYFFEFTHKNPLSNMYLRYDIINNIFSCVYGSENLKLLYSNDMKQAISVINIYDSFKDAIVAMFKFINVENQINTILLDVEKSEIYTKSIKNYKLNR